MEEEIQIPSFTLYPLTTQDLKTCYEAEKYKVLCSLEGPHYPRRNTQLAPHFNIRISAGASSISPEQLVRLESKLQQVMECMIVEDKYHRMAFDFSFEVVQASPQNPPCFLLAPLVNLMAYTCMLKCLEVKSTFACSAALYRDSKLQWDSQDGQNQMKEQDMSLVMASDQRDRRPILLLFQGNFSSLHYEKMASVLQQANQQICRFQLQKAGEVYDLFHQ